MSSDHSRILQPQEQVPEPVRPVKIYCTSCWTDRNITHNGKCPACGAQFPKPAHWNKTMMKIKIILQHEGCVPVEIKGSMYFLPHDFVARYRTLNFNDFRAVGNFMYDIKEQCDSHKV